MSKSDFGFMHIFLSAKTTYNDNFIWIIDFNVTMYRSCIVIAEKMYTYYINEYYSRKCMCLTNLCEIYQTYRCCYNIQLCVSIIFFLLSFITNQSINLTPYKGLFLCTLYITLID